VGEVKVRDVVGVVDGVVGEGRVDPENRFEKILLEY
jgi:hypothetical protein